MENDYLAGLQIGHHAQQLGPVGARAGCLLAVDAGDVVAVTPIDCQRFS